MKDNDTPRPSAERLAIADKRLRQRYEHELKRYALINQQNDITALKNKCFPQKAMERLTFAKSKLKTTDAHVKAKRYADRFDRYFKAGKGLCIFGAEGTGKTYFACAIANALCEKRVPCVFTSLQSLVYGLREDAKREETLRIIDSVDLLILDDFGSEYLTDFMISKAAEVVNTRYNTNKPMVVTTRLDKKSILHPSPALAPIYSRLMDCCLFVQTGGVDMRRKELNESNLSFKGFYR